MMTIQRPVRAPKMMTPAVTYTVIHPLNDAPETKMDLSTIGRMPMRGATRFVLFTLQSYLVVMVLLVFYRVLILAGLFH
jgi:hypothetical protein